jgi:hypothetical protein
MPTAEGIRSTCLSRAHPASLAYFRRKFSL